MIQSGMANNDTSRKSQSGYFTIDTLLQNKLGSTTNRPLNDKYNLLSSAKLESKAIDIYLRHFHSVYSKQYCSLPKEAQAARLERHHISEFLMIFLHIYVLRSLIGAQSTMSGLAVTVVNDLINIKIEKDALLLPFVKAEVNHLYEGPYRKLFKNKLDISQYLQSALKVEKEIGNLLRAFYERIEDKAQFSKLKQRQSLPQNMDHLQLVRYIKENFKAIFNIKLMRRSQKRQVLSEFHRIIRTYKAIRIPFIMQSSTTYCESIILPRESSENNLVITKLHSYLQGGNKQIGFQKLQEIKKNISRLILVQCFNFFKNTKRVYPNLSIDHINFDLKQLKPIISYEPLLLDAIGFMGQTKHLELRLATEPTPKGFDPELSYLETIEENRLKLERKYYCPLKEGDEQTKTIRQQLKLMEQIHVERLIRIVYFIENGRHLIQDYCQGRLLKNQQRLVKYIKPRISYKEDFFLTIRSIHQQLKEGTLSLGQIFSLKSQKNHTKQFSLNALKEEFKLEEQDDSLLQGLIFNKKKSYFYQRNLLIKEINSMVTGNKKMFKRLINPVKYLINYYLYKLQNIYFTIEVQKIGKKDQQSLRKCLINDISLEQQSEKRNKQCKLIQMKIEQYLAKDTPVGEYVRKKQGQIINLRYIQNQYFSIIEWSRKIKQMKSQYKNLQLGLFQHLMQSLEKDYTDEPLQKQLRLFIKNIRQALSTKQQYIITKPVQDQLTIKIDQLIEERNQRLISYVQYQLNILISNDIKKPATQAVTLHKIQEIMNSEELAEYKNKRIISKRVVKICQYYNQKLLILIKLFLVLKQENVVKLSIIYKSILEQKVGRRVSEMPLQAIQIELDKLLIISKTIESQGRRF